MSAEGARRRVRRGRCEQGLTLIELLVVILIIGVLAAIAIPLFINQKSKATDATGKEVARAGAQAAETYSTDHNGSYGGLEPKVLHEYEPAIQTAAGNNNAYITAAESTESGHGYLVTATSTSGDTFTWRKLSTGEVSRTCQIKTGNNVGGCPNGSW
jgi:type IV pilus assembly protein PilA